MNKRMDRCNPGFVAGMLVTVMLSGCVGLREAPQEPVTPASQPQYTPVPMPGTSTQALPPAETLNSSDLQPAAPQTYIVKKGDTLWDIAKRFLKKPWYWPEIWYTNPDIKNPHRIYPGDVISLYYVNGKPRLGINMKKVPGSTKLQPKIRTYPLDEKDVGIAIQSIRPFLIRPQVVSEEMLDNAPHILDSREARLIYGSNDEVYVHG
ncbi:MAG TPA: LysM peptidoglycan-binding domain-containing protein, partial [Gammaproteobacteria bacterium]|nr:LysM peptidoglycan-binding domain-containing protein [Gammaproteobacteria bacterium]